MGPKKRAASAAAAVESSGDATDNNVAETGPSEAKRGRGRPKGSGTKPPKVPGGKRGRPPLSAEEKAKREAERAAGDSPKKAGKAKKGKGKK